MLPQRYRRLWQRRLRRRPLLPFLIAATVAVDLVIATEGFGPEAHGVFASGFLAAQVSLLAIWVTHSPRGLLTRAAIALLVSVLCGVGVTYSTSDPHYGVKELLVIFTGVCVLLVSTSCLTAGVVGVVSRRLTPKKLRAKQRLTIAGILKLTFLSALLLATFREAEAAVFADPLVVGLIVAGTLPTLWVAGASAIWRPGLQRTLAAVVLPSALLMALLATGATGNLFYFVLQTLFAGMGVALVGWRRPLDDHEQHQRRDAKSDTGARKEPTVDLTV